MRHGSTSDVENLIRETVRLTGRIDCLVNNAGWHPPHLPIDAFSIDDFRELLELNLVSVFAACKLALPYLRETRGDIINMSSLVGVIGQLHATTYVATKGALTAFTKALAIDEAVHGVRVNSVSPGNVYTPLWQRQSTRQATRSCAAWRARMPRSWDGWAHPGSGRLCLYIAAEATFTTGVDHILSGGAELGYGRKSRLTETRSQESGVSSQIEREEER